MGLCDIMIVVQKVHILDKKFNRKEDVMSNADFTHTAGHRLLASVLAMVMTVSTFVSASTVTSYAEEASPDTAATADQPYDDITLKLVSEGNGSLVFSGSGDSETERRANSGDEILVEIKAENNNKIDTLTAEYDESGILRTIELTGDKVLFTMPDESVTLKATFVEDENAAATIEADSDISSYEDYILNNMDRDLVGKGDELVPYDILDVRRTFAERSLMDPDNLTIDGLYENEETVKAFITQHQSYSMLYSVDESSEYIVAVIEMVKTNGTAPVDYAFAKNNDFGEVIDDCIYDAETGLVYIPRTYRVESDDLPQLGSVRSQFLYLEDNVQDMTTPVEVNINSNVKGDVASSGVADVNTLNLGVELQLAEDDKAAIAIDNADLSVKVNGVETEAYEYDAESGALTIEGRPATIQSVDVDVEKQPLVSTIISNVTGLFGTKAEAAVKQKIAEVTTRNKTSDPIVFDSEPVIGQYTHRLGLVKDSFRYGGGYNAGGQAGEYVYRPGNDLTPIMDMQRIILSGRSGDKDVRYHKQKEYTMSDFESDNGEAVWAPLKGGYFGGSYNANFFRFTIAKESADLYNNGSASSDHDNIVTFNNTYEMHMQCAHITGSATYQEDTAFKSLLTGAEIAISEQSVSTRILGVHFDDNSKKTSGKVMLGFVSHNDPGSRGHQEACGEYAFAFKVEEKTGAFQIIKDWKKSDGESEDCRGILFSYKHDGKTGYAEVQPGGATNIIEDVPVGIYTLKEVTDKNTYEKKSHYYNLKTDDEKDKFITKLSTCKYVGPSSIEVSSDCYESGKKLKDIYKYKCHNYSYTSSAVLNFKKVPANDYYKHYSKKSYSLANAVYCLYHLVNVPSVDYINNKMTSGWAKTGTGGTKTNFYDARLDQITNAWEPEVNNYGTGVFDSDVALDQFRWLLGANSPLHDNLTDETGYVDWLTTDSSGRMSCSTKDAELAPGQTKTDYYFLVEYTPSKGYKISPEARLVEVVSSWPKGQKEPSDPKVTYYGLNANTNSQFLPDSNANRILDANYCTIHEWVDWDPYEITVDKQGEENRKLQGVKFKVTGFEPGTRTPFMYFNMVTNSEGKASTMDASTIAGRSVYYYDGRTFKAMAIGGSSENAYWHPKEGIKLPIGDYEVTEVSTAEGYELKGSTGSKEEYDGANATTTVMDADFADGDVTWSFKVTQKMAAAHSKRAKIHNPYSETAPHIKGSIVNQPKGSVTVHKVDKNNPDIDLSGAKFVIYNLSEDEKVIKHFDATNGKPSGQDEYNVMLMPVSTIDDNSWSDIFAPVGNAKPTDAQIVGRIRAKINNLNSLSIDEIEAADNTHQYDLVDYRNDFSPDNENDLTYFSPYHTSFMITDSDGITGTPEKYLPAGKYLIREVEAPKGYSIDKEWYVGKFFEVEEDDREFSYTVKNEKVIFDFSLKKEGPNGEALKGATFAYSLTNKAGVAASNKKPEDVRKSYENIHQSNYHEFVVTADNGIYTSANGPMEPNKTYVFFEVDAPDGYSVNRDWMVQVTMSAKPNKNGEYTATVYHYDSTKHKWIKEDDQLVRSDGVVNLTSVGPCVNHETSISTVLLSTTGSPVVNITTNNVTYHQATVEKRKFSDRVTYKGLETGKSYRLEGQLIDYYNGEQTVLATASQTFKAPDANRHTVDLPFNYESNPSNMSGHRYVAFEKLIYIDDNGTTSTDDDKDVIVAEECNLNSTAQSIYFGSVSTKATTAETLGHDIINRKSVSKVNLIDTVTYSNLAPNATYNVKTYLYPIVKDGSGYKKSGDAIATVTKECKSSAKGSGTWTINVNNVDASKLVDSNGNGKLLIFTDTISFGNSLVASHESLSDKNQMMRAPSITTTVIDPVGKVSNSLKVTDRIDYKGLAANTNYTIVPSVKDLTSGSMISVSNVKVNGKSGNIIKLSSSDRYVDGSFNVEFTINTSALAGHKLVVYEEVKRLVNGKLTVITEHKGDTAEYNSQKIYLPSVSTQVNLSNNIVGHVALANKNFTLNDKVTLSDLVPGKTYTMYSELCEVENNKVKSVVAKNVKAITVANSSNESVSQNETVSFTFNAENYRTNPLVVTERLYEGNIASGFDVNSDTAKNALLATHTAVNNVDDKNASAYKQSISFPSISTQLLTADSQGTLQIDGKYTLKDTISYKNVDINDTYYVKSELFDVSSNAVIKDSGWVNVGSPKSRNGSWTTTFENISVNHTTAIAAREYVAVKSTDGKYITVSQETSMPESQKVYVMRIRTQAVSEASGSKTGALSDSFKIKDTLYYDNMKVTGTSYELVTSLKLYDPATKKYTNVPIKGISETGTKDYTISKDKTSYSRRFTPVAGTNKNVSMVITVDTRTFSGKSLYVCQQMIETDHNKRNTVANHTDCTKTEMDSQRIDFVTISTKATDNSGDKMTNAKKNAAFIDRVKVDNVSRIDRNDDFFVSGKLKDKTANKVLSQWNYKAADVRSDGRIVFGESAGINTAVDTTNLAGHTLVFEESLYRKNTSGAYELLAVHNDDSDFEQQIFIPRIVKTELARAVSDNKLLKTAATKPNQKFQDKITYENLIPNTEYRVETTFIQLGSNTANDKKLSITADDSMASGGKKTYTKNGETIVTSFKTGAAKSGEYVVSGSTTVMFSANLTNRPNATFVVYETIRAMYGPNYSSYEDKPLGDDSADAYSEVIASHTDRNDVNQMVYTSSVGTTALSNDTKSHDATVSKDYTLTDTVRYTNLIKGKTYTVTGQVILKSTGKPLTLKSGKTSQTFTFVAGDNKTDTVVAKKSGNKTVYELVTSGSVDIEFTFDATNITHQDAVVYETLLQDGFEITTHADIDDGAQTVYVPEISTTAHYDNTDDHEGLASKITRINDVVSYKNLEVGKEYILHGELRYKTTGERVDVGDGPIVKNVPFTPKAANEGDIRADGNVNIAFDEFNASALEGKSIVVYETLLRDGVEIAWENKPDNGPQEIYFPKIRTELKTINAVDGKSVELKTDLAKNGVQLKDVISYSNLRPGRTYTIETQLIDVDTKKPVNIKAKDSDKAADKIYTTLTAGDKDASAVVEFTADFTGCEGKSFVCYETLCVDSDPSFTPVVETPDEPAPVDPGMQTMAGTNGRAVAIHNDIKDSKQTIYIPEIGTQANSKDTKDQEGTVKKDYVLVDTVSYDNLIAGRTYTLTGSVHFKDENGNDAGIVKLTPGEGVDDKGETKTITFVAGSKETDTIVDSKDHDGNVIHKLVTKGTVDIEFTIDASTFEGKTIVVFEDVYDNGVKIGTHHDISDIPQTITFPKIQTKVYVGGTESNMFIATDDCAVRDSVQYENLVPNTGYTLTGYLVDVKTNERVKDANGADVTFKTPFTSNETGTGETNVDLRFNALNLEGKTSVIFMQLIRGVERTRHEDAFDTNEYIVIPKIRTELLNTKNDLKTALADKDQKLAETITYDNFKSGIEYMVKTSLFDVTANKFADIQLEGDTKTTKTVVTYFTTDNVETSDVAKAYTSEGTHTVNLVVDMSGCEDHTFVAYDKIYVKAGLGYRPVEETPDEPVEETSDEPVEAPIAEYAKASIPDDGNIPIVIHEDDDDAKQTVYVPKVETTALSKEPQDHEGITEENFVLEDTVEFTNLIKGRTYTLTGSVRLKEAGVASEDSKMVPLTADSEDGFHRTITFVAGETTTTSTVKCYDKDGNYMFDKVSGSVVIDFTFNADVLRGKTTVVFEDLYDNDVRIGTHHDIDDDDQTVTFPKIQTMAYDVQRGVNETLATDDVAIQDVVSYENLVVGKEYTLEGRLVNKRTNEFVRDENGEIIVSRNVFVPTESDDTETMDFALNASDMAGDTIVVFEKLYSKGVVRTTHEDITDDAQSIHFPKIGTTLRNAEGNLKMVLANADVTLIDTIDYANLNPDRTYIIKGALIDKDTKETVTEAEKEFSPETPDGAVELEFDFNTDGLDGHTLVAFERIAIKDAEKPFDDMIIAVHEDINDEGQTIYIPEVHTTAITKATGDHEGITEDNYTVTDRVFYDNLVPGREYVITGEVHVRVIGSDGNYIDKGAMQLSDKTYTVSVTCTPDEPTGYVDLEFTFDASEMKGQDAVVYETLTDTGVVIGLHADITDESQTIHFPGIHTNAYYGDTNINQGIATDKVVVRDVVTYTNLTPGKGYTIKGQLMDKATGKPVVDTSDEPITGEVEMTPDTPNGQIEVKFDLDATDMSGKTVVVFEKLISKDTDDTPVTRTTHEDINDEAQSVHFPTIRTTLVKGGTNVHNAMATKDVTLVDTITYTNLVPGKVYKVTGTLMDKKTGEKALDDNGNVITAETTFSPKTADGTVDVTFKFSGVKLENTTVVAFEEIYHKNELIAVHADIEDENQSVSFPKIGTTAIDAGTKTHMLSKKDTVTVIDTVKYEGLIPNEKYVMSGVLMDKASGQAATKAVEVAFTPKTANGSVDVEFNVSDIEGMTFVAFEELKQIDKDNSKIVIAEHKDINDEAQTVHGLEVHTTATFEDGESKAAKPSNDTIIKDKVVYTNLVPNKEYTITGKVVDKNGNVVKGTDGKDAVVTTKFTPKAADGDITVEFHVNTKDLLPEDQAGSVELVCFEYVYDGKVLIGSHEDLNDKDQTVQISNNPSPVTGARDFVPYFIAIAMLLLASAVVVMRKKKNAQN